jgi:imidazolonepropionase-like amidohydrolase
MLDDDRLSTEKLKSAIDAVETAELAIKAKAETEAYAQAKISWKQQVESVLSSGKLDKDQRDQLRVSTLALYKAYGIQFE